MSVYVWGAVIGFLAGTVITAIILTLAAFYDDYRERKNIPKYIEEWQRGFREAWEEMDIVWKDDEDDEQ